MHAETENNRAAEQMEKNDPNKKPLVIKGVRHYGNYVKSEIM